MSGLFSTPGPGTGPGGRFRGLDSFGKAQIVLATIAIIIAPAAIFFFHGESDPISVGDCLSGDGDDLRVVACDDAAARWRVLARLDGRAEADFDDDDCRGQPGATASLYRHGRRFSRGYVLCVAPAR